MHTSAPTTKRKGTFSLKVLVAPTLGVLTRIRFILAQSTKYIYIHNGSYTANQPFILAAVKEHVGNNHIIVALDRFEIKESSGTEGLHACICTASLKVGCITDLNCCRHQ